MCAAASIERYRVGGNTPPEEEMTAVAAGTLFECARALLAEPFHQAVNGVLRRLGSEADADRVWIFVYNEDATLFRNTHEWCRGSLSQHGEDLQDVPVSMIAWLQEMLVAEQAVMVRRISALPRSAKALRLEFERQHDKSVFSVPIFRDGKIWGCIGYDAVVEEKSWGAAEARLLFLCGRLISEAARERGDMPAGDGVRRNGSLYLNGADGNTRVEIRDIIGVKSEGDYTRVYFPGGGSALELRPLKTWVSLLPKEDFQQIHRSAIINVRCVAATRHSAGGGMTVTMTELPEEWSVSRTFRADLRSRLGF